MVILDIFKNACKVFSVSEQVINESILLINALIICLVLNVKIFGNRQAWYGNAILSLQVCTCVHTYIARFNEYLS